MSDHLPPATPPKLPPPLPVSKTIESVLPPPPDPSKIDRRQLKILTQVFRKLMLRSAVLTRQAGRKKDVQLRIRTFMLSYGLPGAFMGLLISKASFSMGILFITSYTMMMVFVILLTDAETLLFNPAEADILGPHPINARTRLAARLINILFLLLLIAVPLNIIPSLVLTFKREAAYHYSIAHYIAVAMAAAFTTALTACGYGYFLGRLKKEALQNTLVYIQVGFMLVGIGMWQMLSQVGGRQRPMINWEPTSWTLVFPPVWFASLAKLINGSLSHFDIIGATLAVASTGALMWIALMRFSANYQDAITAMTERRGGAITGPKSATSTDTAAPVPSRWCRTMQRVLLVRRGEELAAFRFIWTFLSRDHELKRRLYPSLALLIIMPAIGILSGGLNDPFVRSSHQNPGSSFAGIIIVMLATIGLTTVDMLRYSSQYDAAYIFRAVPLRSIARFYTGIIKAVIGAIVLPGQLTCLVVVAVLWKNPEHAIQFLLPSILISWPLLLLPFAGKGFLPFSEPPKEGQQVAKLLSLFIFVVIIAIFVAMAVWLLGSKREHLWYGLAAMAAFSLVLSAVLYWIIGRKRGLLIQD